MDAKEFFEKTCSNCYWLNEPHIVNADMTCAELGRSEDSVACVAHTETNPYKDDTDK